ncbi:MAG TPA: cytochrome P450 [Acidimicrobiales bacterium]|nr:cytochrome P450 [Acidimicrobiales bacterium]
MDVEDELQSPSLMVDLASADDPRAMSEMLRQQRVHNIEGMFHLLTHRQDVEAALRRPAVFTSGPEAVQLGNIRPLIPLSVDPPKHVKYRRILDPLFAPRHMTALEGEVAELVNSTIDNFAASGTCDFHEDFAVPLPCTVFLRLMGLPLEDLDLFLAMKDGIIRPSGATMEDQAPTRKKTAENIYAYFEKTLEQRRRAPTEDLLARIMVSEVDGVRLTDEEILDICFLFIIAGLDTVTDTLDCIFGHLSQNPDHRRQVAGDESVIPSAIEELLRWESPVPAVPRVLGEDVEIDGCPMKAGEHVMLLIGAANTDTTDHPGVDSVDLMRNPNPHLAFGGGVHRCLGSHLARVELRVAMREWHKRIPEYELVPGTVLEYTEGLRSLHHLPLQFPPAP